jgi:hypothetical protein
MNLNCINIRQRSQKVIYHKLNRDVIIDLIIIAAFFSSGCKKYEAKIKAPTGITITLGLIK